MPEALADNDSLLPGASIWFCGPAAFGQSVRAGLVAQGLAASDFHQELFCIR
jgi:ferredoxin-NADP reductase